MGVCIPYQIRYTRKKSEKMVYDDTNCLFSLDSVWRWICNFVPRNQKENIIMREDCIMLKVPGYEGVYINQIATDKGIIFSDGEFTGGQKFCAPVIKKWMEDCQQKINPVFYPMTSEEEEED